MATSESASGAQAGFTVKVIGRRQERKVSIDDARELLKTAAALHPTDKLVPCGLYRFGSFEEANSWMTTTTARTLARLRSKTSSGSADR